MCDVPYASPTSVTKQSEKGIAFITYPEQLLMQDRKHLYLIGQLTQKDMSS